MHRAQSEALSAFGDGTVKQAIYDALIGVAEGTQNYGVSDVKPTYTFAEFIQMVMEVIAYIAQFNLRLFK